MQWLYENFRKNLKEKETKKIIVNKREWYHQQKMEEMKYLKKNNYDNKNTIKLELPVFYNLGVLKHFEPKN